jgi:hypothetical protein
MRELYLIPSLIFCTSVSTTAFAYGDGILSTSGPEYLWLQFDPLGSFPTAFTAGYALEN